MKDKRNCNNNMNYPIYMPFQDGQFFNGPMMVPPMGYPNYQAYPNYNNNNNLSSNIVEQQYNNLEQQINQLDQRVTRLERQYINNNNNNNNKYNDSNYYMV